MADPLGSEHLQQFIAAQRIEATILPMNGYTPTVNDAARELNVSTEQIIKSLVFMSAESPLLVINNGLSRVDRRKLAAHLAVGRKKVKFASADQALAITGFVVGSMPPFGHRQTLRTLVDPAVLAMDTIYGGGGAIDAMMRLTPGELLRVTGAETVPISET
jgi:prolyl-tRNA editing enzyme YbaK/EbsC (Cys-tRNA(Pro) deacylase)